MELRRLTRGSRVPVVSLVVPGRPSSHSWFPGARRLTRGSRVPVVSLLVPGFPSSHSWFLGFRRLTRGSRVSVVSLVIPYSSPFFRKKFLEKS